VLALEAVLLTSFVLIRQNAMDLRSERRNHLDLQINLLAEKEATSILNALREIADHLGVDVSNDAEREELAKDTPVEDIARDLRANEKKS
jgi:Predicted membrane protein